MKNRNFNHPLRRGLAAVLVALAVLAGLTRMDVWKVEAEEGTAGDLTWTLAEGTLTISGDGAMPDYTESRHAPWYDYRDSITTVVIGGGVTEIGEFAFHDCTGLTAASLPDSVTVIGREAFSGCAGLADIQIPAGVTEIDDGAFWGCAALTQIRLPSGISRMGANLFNGCTGLTDITIPVGVTRIHGGAFLDCTGLTQVRIPYTVTRIDRSAFKGCTNVRTLVFVGDAPTMESDIFTGVVAEAYYPGGNGSWTEEVRRSYGGLLTWIQGEPGPQPEQPEGPETLRGDLNGDGVENSDDAIYLLYYVLFGGDAYPLH